MADFPTRQANGTVQYQSPPVALASIGLSVPASFAGIQIWLCSDDLALQGAAAPANNDPVSTWRSRVKSPWSATEQTFTGSLTTRPLYKTNIQNSLPGVLFDGTDDLMTGPTDWSNLFGRGERTAFIVCKPTVLVATGSGVVYSRPQLIGTVGQYNGISVSPSGGNNIFTQWDYEEDGSTLRSNSTGSIAANSMVLITEWHQAGAVYISLNEAAPVTSAMRNITTSGSTMQLGTSGGGAFYTGHLFEIILYSRALSTHERDSVSDYLRAKWSF